MLDFRKYLLSLIILTGFLLFINNYVSASAGEKKTHRIESSFSYEHLTPNAIYGEWKTINVSYFSTPSDGFTYFLQSSLYNRPEDDGLTGTIGAYKDWNRSLYTYSAVTIGSNTTFLPELRVDHDFNFKLGAKKNLILTIGGTYIDYFSDHSDIIFSVGPTYYWKKWIFQYRYFHNQSDPGSVSSYSQLINAGYGEEGHHWTWLSYSFGNQAYLATYLVLPEEVNRDSFELNLRHRHWLTKHYGIFGNMSYFELDKGYDKIGFALGFFYEF